MKIRKRLKVKARRVKVESAFVDFDDGVSVQIPLFHDRVADPTFDIEKELGERATTALRFDANQKGTNTGEPIEVVVTTESILDVLKRQPGALIDDYQ